MGNPSGIRLVIRQKQSTKQIQRRIVFGGLLALFVFGGSFIYWNLFNNTATLAAAVNYTWTGTTDSLWTTSSNWSPAGVPTSIDNITVGTVARSPVLTSNQAVNNFIINNNGSLNINNNTLQINGTANFNGGTNLKLSNVGFIIAFGTTTTFGTAGTTITIGTSITVSSGTLTFTKSTFNGITNLTKTGTTNDQSAGNNIFNGVTSITNSGTGYLLMSNSTNDIFNADVTFSSTGSGIIYPAYNGTGTQFNQNIIINSTGTGGIRIGGNVGTSTLASTKLITIGSSGFSSGVVQFANFTPAGNTAQTFSSTGTGVLTLGPGTTFSGDVTATCGGICLNGTTFNGAALITKTGTTNDQGQGNNIYNGTTSFTNNGTGYILMANSTRDIFNTDVTFISTTSGVIYPAYNGTGTQFNQNIIVTSTSSGGVRIGANVGTSTLALNKTISIGSGGFSSGLLSLANFTPTGSNPFSITLTGAGVLGVGPATTFNGDFTATCGGICLNGATFNGASTITKTGTTNDAGNGNNTFNGATTITNNGTGYLLMSNSTRDIFNSDINFISTNSGIIYPAYNGSGSQFNQNIVVTSTSSGGVRIGANVGTSTLALNKTINIGSGGFSSGMLSLGNFTPAGSNPFSISLTGSAVLGVGPATTFGGDFTTSCGGICLNGATFNGATTITKTGTTNDAGAGNNVFNGTTTITNSGTGYLLMSNSTRDIFNTDANFISTNSGIIYPAYNGTGTQFNQNIIITSIGTGGVRIGANIGTSILADTKKINIGSGGFIGGMLQLGNFTTAGTTAQSITLTGGGILTLGPSTIFPGDVTANCGGICLSGAIFNGLASLTKNGSTNDSGSGNNIFNGTTTITNNGTGYLLLANSTRDIFNTDANFISTNSGIIYPAYNGSGTQFNQNIVLTSSGTGGVRIGANVGTSTLAATKNILIGSGGFTNGLIQFSNFTTTGTTAQTITGTGLLTLGPATTFTGDLTASCGGFYLNGTTFNGLCTLTKTGASNEQGTGNNLFNGSTTITNSGTGYLLFSNTTRDIYNSPVTYTCTNSGLIYTAYAGASTMFNQNIVINCTGTGGIRFGANTGTSALASGKTISVGPSGFTSGELSIGKFTQTGSTSQSINLSSGTAILNLNAGTTFNGDVNFSFPQMTLNGTTFNGNVTLEKTGATNNASSGSNIYNGNVSIKNSGSGNMYLGNSTSDNFNANATFIQTGTGALFPAYNSNTTFAGDISTAGSTAIITFANAAGGVVTFDGTSATQNIYGSAIYPPILNRLTVNNSSNGINLNVPVTINTNLTLTSGNINSTSTNLLIIGSGITTINNVSDASYINGPVRKIGKVAFTFPIGKNGHYRPISISAPTLVTDHYTAEYINSDPNVLFNINSHDAALNHMSRCEYWSLYRTNGATNVSVTLSWNSTSCGVSSLNDLRVSRWDTTQTKWLDLGNSLTAGDVISGTIKSTTTVGTFGAFSLGSSSASNALPVELINFTVEKENESALLKWQTASEKNNDFFTVEKSVDGNYFESIGTVKGVGNSTVKHSYQLTDENPFNGSSYYRLKQTDFDGHSETFKIVMFDISNSISIFKINSVGPNPFSDILHIQCKSDNESEISIEIINTAGSLVFQTKRMISVGENTIDVDITTDLKPGMYLLKLVNGDRSTEPVKLLKK